MIYEDDRGHICPYNEVYKKSIHIVDDFVDVNDCKLIVDFAITKCVETNEYAGYPRKYEDADQLKELVFHANSALELASATYGRTLIFAERPKIRALPPRQIPEPGEGYLHLHSDSEYVKSMFIDLSKNFTTYDNEITPGLNEVTALLYLTEDFDGGHLEFPDYNLSIKPRAGQLVMFPSGHQYLHRVTEVTRGERIYCTLFFTTPKIKMLFEQVQ
jgi:hypothetical protein